MSRVVMCLLCGARISARAIALYINNESRVKQQRASSQYRGETSKQSGVSAASLKKKKISEKSAKLAAAKKATRKAKHNGETRKMKLA